MMLRVKDIHLATGRLHSEAVSGIGMRKRRSITFITTAPNNQVRIK